MKKQFTAILASCLLLGILTGCGDPVQQQAADVITAEPAPVSDAAEAQTAFALHLVQQAYQSDPEKNVLLSPYSAMQALAMTANGAANQTRSEMEQALGGIPLDSLNASLRDLRNTLTESKKATFQSANAVWVNDTDRKIVLNQNFEQMVTNGYNAKISAGAFDDAARNDINAWCRENTGGMIPEFLNTAISPETAMILLNAAFLDGKWEEAFADVRSGYDFTCADRQVQSVTMMINEEKYYLDGEGIKGFVKYYQGGDFAFAAILPDADLQSYLPSLTAENLRALLLHVKTATTPLEVDLPQFKLDCSTDLAPLLKNMGMASAFDRDAADFSGMLENDTPLWISKVQQRVYIDVNRKGTAAAAATEVEVASCEPEQIVFDRPFLYMIIETKNMTPLYAGVLNAVPQ